MNAIETKPKAAKKIAQPSERVTANSNGWVLCTKHFGVHRERVTCTDVRTEW